MKTTHFATLAVLALVAGGAVGCTVYTEAPPPPPPPVAAEVEVSGGAVDVGIFYEGLGSYGEWIERPGYGRVWYPKGVRVGWRPYLYGRWVSSDYGWTWVSEEEFGWATYHYGRWYRDDEVGWVWVPGTEWGPAWVSFQQGSGYIGWAPLPPGVAFRAGIGIQFGGVSIGAATYSFVEERVFLHPQIATVIVPQERNVTIINNTTNITNYTVVNNKVVNQSVSVQHIENVTGQKVQRYQVAAASAKGASTIKGNQIAIYKPNVQSSKAVAKAATPAAQSQRGQGVVPGARAQGGAARSGSGQTSLGQDQAQGKAGGAPGTPGNGTPQGESAQSEQGAPGGGGQRPAAKNRPSEPQGSSGAGAGRGGQVGANSGGANGGGVNLEELNRKHQAEQQQLAARHAAERSQLESTHKSERAAAKGPSASSDELKRKHDAELRALQQQHQKEQAELAARHKQEKAQAAQSKKPSGNKEKKPAGG
jgi:hypothetical protein